MPPLAFGTVADFDDNKNSGFRVTRRLWERANLSGEGALTLVGAGVAVAVGMARGERPRRGEARGSIQNTMSTWPAAP